MSSRCFGIEDALENVAMVGFKTWECFDAQILADTFKHAASSYSNQTPWWRKGAHRRHMLSALHLDTTSPVYISYNEVDTIRGSIAQVAYRDKIVEANLVLLTNGA